MIFVATRGCRSRRSRIAPLPVAFAAAVAVAVAALPSCRVGPDYERPPMETPAAFRGASEVEAAADPMLVDWFEFFTDPVLQELLREAIAGNDDLAIAAARVLEARAGAAIAESRLLPTLDGAASLQGQGISRSGFPEYPQPLDRDGGFTTLGGLLSWELDLWGRFARGAEAAREELLATSLDRAVVMQALIVEVAGAYFRLLATDRDLAITQATIRSRAASLELVRARLGQGIASKLEVRQAESLLQGAELFVPTLEAARDREENLIQRLLGRTPGPVPRGASLDQQLATFEVPAGLPSQLLERRPDLLAAEARLAAATARIGEAKALLYPQISLTAAGGVSSQSLSNLFSGGSVFWDTAIGLTVPIFNAGRLQAGVAASEARSEQAAREYLKAVRTAFAEVADGLSTLDGVRRFRAIQQQRVETLTDQATLSQERYRGGVTSYLEVLDSERQLFEAQRSLVQAQFDEAAAAARLVRALGGGGWAQLVPTAPAAKEMAESEEAPAAGSGAAVRSAAADGGSGA